MRNAILITIMLVYFVWALVDKTKQKYADMASDLFISLIAAIFLCHIN